MLRIDPKASLADDFTNPKCVADGYEVSVAQRIIAGARKYVFDHAAADMVGDLATQPPHVLARLLDACRPASETVWIEMPTRLFFDGSNYGPSGSGGRCAVLAQWAKDGATHCMLVHHTDPMPMVRWWGPGWLLSHQGAPFRENVDTYGDQLRRAVWGDDYDPGRDLTGRARITLNPSMAQHIKKAKGDFTVPAGWARFAIGALTILNSRSIEVSEPARPEGHRLIGGRSRPYTALTPLRLSLPRRVRAKTSYLVREAAIEHRRRRLHEVSPHYRHLKHKPLAAGWQQVEIEGETFWRKRIDAFLRGDPDMGVVDHNVTLVKGTPT